VFRRRRTNEPDPQIDADATDDLDEVDGDDLEETDDEVASTTMLITGADRTNGPYDVSEAPDDGITRLDLGGMLVPGAEGMELRLDLDETAENVMAVTVVDGQSSMQLMAFAAPRTDGIWDDVREEIRVNLASSGPVDSVDGEFGRELRASVVVAGPQGQSLMQPVRFVGIDGPRWFLRALFSGAAARETAAAESLEQVLRAVVVVRGTDPMAPGDQLRLVVPGEVPDGMAKQADAVNPDRPPLSMPERGPEITEIR
jgi:hypothetical protein